MRKNPVKKQIEKGEGNKYDKIFKENLRELTPALLKVVLKLNDFLLKPLPQVRLQTTLEKEPDFLQLIIDEASPLGRVLHIEFEGQDLSIIDWRMSEYAGIGGMVHQREVEQHLIFLGVGQPQKIKGEIEHKFYKYRYKVHSLTEVNFKDFLFGETPQEVVFAILADPGEVGVDEVIRLILERLVQLVGKKGAIRKFVKQLVMLSRKRNLHSQTINKVKIMIGYQDIEDDVVYHLGLDKGIEQGQVKGKEETAIIAIRNAVKKGFDLGAIVEILELQPGYVNKIQKQLTKEADIIESLRTTKGDTEEIAKRFKVNPLVVKVISDHLEVN
jgi:hypothetical protein